VWDTLYIVVFKTVLKYTILIQHNGMDRIKKKERSGRLKCVNVIRILQTFVFIQWICFTLDSSSF